MQERGKKFIRDIIYEYVFFTDLESPVVEHPAFQRLRFVLQNSSAYLTYPSNQLTRFSHSLGVAYVGGRMLISALENAQEEDFLSFINGAFLLIKKEIEELKLEYNDLLNEWGRYDEEKKKTEFPRNISGFTRKINDKSYKSNEFEFKSEEDLLFTVDILWQSLRLTCLTHDIGHFPFSHIFETGLERFDEQIKNLEGEESKHLLLKPFLKKCKDSLQDSIEYNIGLPHSNAEHELFGAYIIKKVTEDKLKKLQEDGNPNNLLALCLKVALKIFLVQKAEKDTLIPQDESKIYGCLSSIVSSEIDADRIDYTLRDARSSGLNVGNFDFVRLLNHTVLAFVREENRFRILVTVKALSSIEQFFNYRYLLYEYIYYHHNVAKYDGLLAEIIRRTLQKAVIDNDKGAEKNEVLEILKRYEFVTPTDDGHFDLFNLDRVEIYDDSWLRAMLLELWRNEEVDETYKIILETFLFRKKENVTSFVKRRYENKSFINELYEYIKKDSYIFEQINIYIHENLTDEIKAKKIERNEIIKFGIRRILSDKQVNSLIETIIKKKGDEEYLIIYKQINPKLASSSAEMFIKNEKGKYGVKKCYDYSSYLQSLLEISLTSMNFYFGCVYLNPSLRFTENTFKDEIKEIFKGIIIEIMKPKQ